jgi:hypothetical protein
MQPRQRPLRVVLDLAGAAVIWLSSAPAGAGSLNQHYLLAQVGQSTAAVTDETFDENESTVQASFQDGVPGTDPNARALFASVNSASGVVSTSGITVDKLVANKGRAFAQIEERMFLDGGSGPVEIDALLLLNGSASGDYIEIDASLQIGDCIVGVRRYSNGDPPFVSNNDCDDTAAVNWEVSGGGGALQITAIFANEPSALDVGAWVSGDFGGSASDVANGEFSSGGALSIGVLGSTASYASPSFLTVPEPGHALLLAVGGAVLVLRRRSARTLAR